MRRPILQAPVLVVLFLALLAVPAAAAQDATPEMDGLPEGASIEVFAQSLVDQLPPAPADVVLVRASFAPGAGVPLDPAEPGLGLVYVESGALSVRAVTELEVTRVAVAGTPVAAEVTAAGVETVLGPGDSAVLPPFIPGTIRNAGTEPAVVLVLIVEPTEAVATPVTEGTPVAAEEMTGDVGFQLLALGHTEELPAGPAGLAIARLTAEPGTDFPTEATTGIQLAHVETGTFALRGEDGPPFEVFSGLEAMATPDAAPTVETGEPGRDVTVGPGEAIFFPAGNVAAVSVTGDETALVLVAVIEPVAGP